MTKTERELELSWFPNIDGTNILLSYSQVEDMGGSRKQV